MKFHQLSMGQRFEFEDEIYVRTKPMTAVHETSGKQRLIRRSATVRVLPQDPAAVSQDGSVKDASALSRAAVLEAFDTFYAACLLSVEKINGDIDNGEVQEKLRQARQRFLDSLSL